MTFTETVQQYFQDNYVNPARRRGQTMVDVRAGDIHSKLGWTRRVPLVCAALSSQKLQRNVGVRLRETEGPPSGQSPTVVFHYEIMSAAGEAGGDGKGRSSSIGAGSGLMDLYGIGADAFRQLGGGESYLRREREQLQFPAEHYPHASGPEKE